MNNQTNWIKILSGFASDSKWKIMLSILLSIISVFSGLVPYWAVFKIILMMINNAYTINSIMVYIFYCFNRLYFTSVLFWSVNDAITYYGI